MKQDKQLAEVLSVSGCAPVYVKGKIKQYNVSVLYNGKLTSYDVIDRIPNEQYYNVLDTNITLPSRQVMGCYCLVDYDPDNDITNVRYCFKNGLFERGGNRAWQFRIQMLALKNKQNCVKVKE